MPDLTSFQKTDLVHDHLAADYNRLLPGVARAEFVNTETITATKTLVDVDCQWQVLNPSTAPRDVRLPAITTASHIFYIYNSGTTYHLAVTNSGGTTTYLAVAPGALSVFVPTSGGSWKPAHVQHSLPFAVDSSNCNLVVNGGMRIAQRSTSLAGITSHTYVVDRFAHAPVNLGTWTVSQDTDTPGWGFKSSLKLLVTTADASPAAGDICTLQHKFEGYQVQHLMKGSAGAKFLFVSFWVKSSTTGTYICELYDNDSSPQRAVSRSYSISSANTWEYKVLLFPGDAAGSAPDNDSALSMYLLFWLAAGTNYTSGTLATSWANVTNANRAVGQTNLAASVNNNLLITGVNMAPADLLTDFRHEPFDVVLARCMRYYQKSFQYATAPAQNAGYSGALIFIAGKSGAASQSGYAQFLVPMRGSPALTFYNPGAANAEARDTIGGFDCSSTAAGGAVGERSFDMSCVGNAGTVVGNTLAVQWSADAEI